MQDGGARLRALVCDDDAASRLLAQRALVRLFPDVEVETANMPLDAMRLLETRSYDLVLADYRFPAWKNGADILEAAVRDCPHALRLLITGHPDVDILRDGLNKGRAHGVIVKGQGVAELADELRRLVNRAATRAANT